MAIIIIVLLIILIGACLYLYNYLRRLPAMYLAGQAANALQEINKEEQEKAKYLQQETKRIQEIINYDKNFSKDYLVDLLSKAFPLTLELQNPNAVSKLEPYVTPSFLEDFVRELHNLSTAQNRVNKDIKIKDIYITDFIPSDHLLTIRANLLAEYNRTYYNENGAIQKMNHVRSIYKIDLVKTEEVTQYDETSPITNCPNCGSPVNILIQTHCEYCGTEIYKKSNVWLIHTVSNATKKEDFYAKS